MGMFDSFTMPGIEMPDGNFYPEAFQTKDLACDLDEYRVTPDGRVMRSVKNDDYEHVKWESSQLSATGVTLRGPITLRANFFMGRLSTLDII